VLFDDEGVPHKESERCLVAAMDVGLLATGDASFKVPAHEVVDLTSDDNLDSQDAVSEPPLAGDLNADLGSVSGADDEIEPSESFSLLEDVLEEMGDDHLFNGGKLPHVATSFYTV
jgi:hypothetical protein